MGSLDRFNLQLHRTDEFLPLAFLLINVGELSFTLYDHIAMWSLGYVGFAVSGAPRPFPQTKSVLATVMAGRPAARSDLFVDLSESSSTWVSGQDRHEP